MKTTPALSCLRIASLSAMLSTAALPAWATPITFQPQLGQFEVQANAGSFDGKLVGTYGGTNGVSRTIEARAGFSDPNPNGGVATLEARSQAYQLSAYDQTGITFDGSAAASLSITNPFDFFQYGHSASFLPSQAASQFVLNFTLTEATRYTFDATISVLGAENSQSDHEIFLAPLGSFSLIAGSDHAGSIHTSGILLAGTYQLGASFIAASALSVGPSEADYHGSFALKFLPDSPAAVPEGSSTAAALMLGLGVCWQARRRLGPVRQ